MEEREIEFNLTRNEIHIIYHTGTVRTFPKANIKVVKRGEIGTTNTRSCLGTCTSIK